MKYLIYILQWCYQYIHRYIQIYDTNKDEKDSEQINSYKEKNFVHINKMILSSWLLLSNLAKIYPGQMNHEFLQSNLYNKEKNEITSNHFVSIYIFTTLYNIIEKLKEEESMKDCSVF